MMQGSKLTIASTLMFITTPFLAHAQETSRSQSFLQTNVVFQARRDTNYHNPDDTPVDFAANVVEVDTHGSYDPSTYRFRPRTPGWYEIGINVLWILDARQIDDADIQAGIQKNGSTVADFQGVAYSSPLPTWDYTVGGQTLVYLNGTTDWITWYSYTSSWDASGDEVAGSRSWVNAKLISSNDASVLFQARRDSSYHSPDNTLVDFAANVVEVDTHGSYDASTHRFTPTTPGWYEIGINLMWELDARTIDDADIQADIRKNGFSVADFQGVAYNSPLPTWDFTSGGQTLIYLNGTTDYVTWHSYTSSWNATGEQVSGPRSRVNAKLVKIPYEGVTFRAVRSVDYHNPNNTLVNFSADVIDVDNRDAYDASAYTFTPKVPGWYEIGVHIMWMLDARTIDDADIQAVIRKNESDVADFQRVAYSSPLPTWDFSVGGQVLVYLNGTTDSVTWHSYTSSWDASGEAVSGSRSWVQANLVSRR